MRWIFISLFVGNLLVFAWGMVSGSSADEQVSARPQQQNLFRDYPQLKLLSEIQTGAVERKSALTRLAGTNSPNMEGRPLCELVGPFATEDKASTFVERLSAIEVRSTIRDMELPAGPGYWVYLAPRADRREALRLLSELQSKRIDSYIVPKGDLENGISLGMFSKKASADSRVKEMVALGLKPQVDEIERSYREIWVMLDPGEQQKMSEFSWERVMQGLNMAERRQNYCLDVASQQNFQ